MEYHQNMKKDYFLNTCIVIGISFIFYLTVRAISFGAFAFWFDPARDLGLGLDNLKKLSLIGHPSGGLAGVFYGPYYIWFISLAEIVSKDPRWVWFAFATVPYFTLFPFILYKFKDYADTTILLTLWLIFLLSFNNHLQIWNPNPTPIMYLFAVYFANRIFLKSKIKFVFAFFTGLSTGFIANFHMSFGSAIILSFFLIFLIDNIVQFFNKTKEKNKLIWMKFVSLILYCVGVAVTYIPFFLFEVRHGFNQIKIIMMNFQLGITKGISLNDGQGFSKWGIVNYFFVQGEKLLHIPSSLIWLFLLGSICVIFYTATKKNKKAFTPEEIKLLLIVLTNAITVLAVFLNTKNPVYDYFFISVEMFFLLPTLVIAKKIPVVKFFFVGLAFYLILIRANSEVQSFGKKNTSSNYESKRKTIDLIYKNAKQPPFTVYIYDPAIYTFDYDYIIRMYKEKYGFEPNREKTADNIIYIILPESKNKGALQSFVDYHTPSSEYVTKQSWGMDDGTTVLERERLK